MVHFGRWKQPLRIPRLWRIWLLFLIATPVLLLFRQHSSTVHELVLPPPPANLSQFEKFCWLVNVRILFEPPFDKHQHLTSRNEPIPYFYAQWKSSPDMPRLLTPCEHAIYIHLLKTLVENVFNKYNISYMMMAATLLGSYTRHDLLPWDDDVDLRVSISDRSRLQSIVREELSSPTHSIVLMQMHNERNYDKIYFSWCPKAGRYSWSFPFVDIFYHDGNSTHVWLDSIPASCPLPRQDVFPLVLRPLGPLWLYAPREPMAHFDSRRMTRIETGCFRYPFSHKYERLMDSKTLYADCSTLQSVYPYVERKCTRKKCVEHLKLGNKTFIHTITFIPAYRTFLYAERDSSYQPC